MMQANGRLNIKKEAAGKNKEKAKLNKMYVCAKCGAVDNVSEIEFGEQIVCEVCGHYMQKAK